MPRWQPSLLLGTRRRGVGEPTMTLGNGTRERTAWHGESNRLRSPPRGHHPQGDLNDSAETALSLLDSVRMCGVFAHR